MRRDTILPGDVLNSCMTWNVLAPAVSSTASNSSELRLTYYTVIMGVTDVALKGKKSRHIYIYT